MKILAQTTAAAVVALCCTSGSAAAAGMPADTASWLDGIAGKTLIAIDGSSVSLAPSEGGLTREIIAPNGSVQKMAFTFMNETLGTIADARDAATVIGFFHDTKDGLNAQFADGHTETLAANTDGGLSMTVHAPGGGTFCMAWYPKGHMFNQAERQAALAEYAKRLGIALPGAKNADGAVDSGCASRPATREAANHAVALPPAKGAVPAKDPAPPEAVLVRASAVHLIDGDPVTTDRAGKQASAGDDANRLPDGPGASSCLSVDSDGHHWGFRNQCDYAVQFAYCLKDGGNPLTACESGTVPGSVAAKGFAALLADKTLSETDAEHNFRWVACSGGAGEVVPQLDRTSPPSGRCIRASAS